MTSIDTENHLKSVALQLRSTNHMGFHVGNLDRSIQFYSGLLGQEPFHRDRCDEEWVGTLLGYPGSVVAEAFFHLPNSDAFLELLEYEIPAGQVADLETFNIGNAHLCFEVADLESEYQRVTALGGTFRSAAPVLIPSGPWKGALVAYCRDPDGISIEFVQLP